MSFVLFPPLSPDDSEYVSSLKWTQRPLTYAPGDEQHGRGWNQDSWERELSLSQTDPQLVFDYARARLINFDIAPAKLAHFTPSWTIKERLPQAGDIVFQRTHLLGLGWRFVIDVLSVTRIVRVVDESHYFELQYTTTKGHPECGTARYRVARIGDQVLFSIDSVARPGLWITRLATSIITRHIQLAITKGILDMMVQGVRLDLAAQES